LENFKLFADMMRRGPGGAGCGDPSKPIHGEFIGATDVYALTTALFKVIGPDGPDTRLGTCFTPDAPESGLVDPDHGQIVLDLPLSLSAFTLLAQAADKRVDVSLVAPDGEIAQLVPGAPITMGNGTRLEVHSLSDHVFLVSGQFPTTRTDWAGRWSVRYCTDDKELAKTAKNQANLYLFGGLRLQVRDTPLLRRGRTGSFTVELVNEAGQPTTKTDWSTDSTIKVSADGRELIAPMSNADGSLTFEYKVPVDYSPDALSLHARVAPIVKVSDDIDAVPLPPWEGDLASVRVADIPKYPYFEGDPSAFTGIDKDHLTTQSTITVVADPNEGGGCLTLVAPPEVDRADGMTVDPTVKVLAGETEIVPGQDCSVRLNDGESREITFWVETTKDQLRVTTERMMIVTSWSAVSAADPSQRYERAFASPVHVEPNVDINVNWWKVVGYMVFALVPPLILLYLYNLLVAARFEPLGAAHVATISVVIDGGQVTRSGKPGAPIVTTDDLKPLMGPEGRARAVNFKDIGLSFVARPARSLFGEAFGLVTVNGSGGRVVLSSNGRSSRDERGALGLSLSRAWVLSVAAKDLNRSHVAGDVGGERLKELHGTLRLVIGGDSSATIAFGTEKVPRVITEICEEILEVAARHLLPRALAVEVDSTEGSGKVEPDRRSAFHDLGETTPPLSRRSMFDDDLD
jgi:hypothetical protein